MQSFEFSDAHDVRPPIFTGFDPGHVAQFYEKDDFLAAKVVDFLAAGLAAGQAAIAIATPAHREAFTTGLSERGLDVDRLLADGRLAMVDAHRTLGRILTNGAVDAALFKTIVGGLLASGRTRGSHPCVRAFGELVDILTKEGNPSGAIRIEELWNDLASEHRFSLLCAYALGSFSTAAHGPHFQDICRHHSGVVPAEMYSVAGGDDASPREMAALQQRAHALQHELGYRQQLEAALRDALARERNAHADAERANRVKDDFLAVLSHELRTPLNAILGWTQIIKAGSADRTTVARGVEVIGRNAELQSRLIDDLLDMSRIIRGQMQIRSDVVDIGATAAATIESVRPLAAAKGIDLDLQLEPEVVEVVGDAARLHQIVWNLLSNALKFSHANGRVTLTVRRVGSEAVIELRDSGQGIPRHFLPHVFDRFRQADNSTTRRHGGLGLGLAVVRHLAEAHGGTVAAESEGPGLGATFTVRLPLRGAIAPRALSSQPSS